MEGNFRSETRRRPLPQSAANIGLTRSNSDASSLTAENRRDIFCSSQNVTPDDCTAWTDEKHNSYLHHLEVSFVKQLYQLKSSLAQCSVQNQRDLNIYQKRMMNVNNASEQNGCRQKINDVRGEPLSSSTSADSHTSLKCRRMCNFKNTSMHSHPSSAKKPSFHGKGMISHGMPTCSQEYSTSNPYDGDLIDIFREGSGQNFLDEGNQSASKFESRGKRSKVALDDGSLQDQIVPSRICPKAHHSVINGSTHGEEQARYESDSETREFGLS